MKSLADLCWQIEQTADGSWASSAESRTAAEKACYFLQSSVPDDPVIDLIGLLLDERNAAESTNSEAQNTESPGEL